MLDYDLKGLGGSKAESPPLVPMTDPTTRHGPISQKFEWGSVAGLVTLASQLPIFLRDTISQARSAPSNIRSLVSELDALCVALANLQTAVNLDDLSNNPRFPGDDLSNVLDYIMKDFILLRTVISKTISNAADSVLTRWGKRVSWVFHEAEVEGLRSKLEAYKTTLLITITTASLLTSTGTSEDIQTLRTEL